MQTSASFLLVSLLSTFGFRDCADTQVPIGSQDPIDAGGTVDPVDPADGGSGPVENSLACDRDDASPVGECALSAGFYWNGNACLDLVGCSCTGEDCDSLSPDVATCLAVHSKCTSCDPMDARRGADDCERNVGFYWDGSSCRDAGCVCEGTDCGNLFGSFEDCYLSHVTCNSEPGEACGQAGDTECSSDKYCSWGELAGTAAACGAADQLGYCQPRPEACSEIDSPVCGCDLRTYENACLANAAGQDVLLFGPCDAS